MHFIGPNKHRSEVITAPFDFSDQVPTGTVITAGQCACTVTVFSGTDASPQNILFGSPSVVGGTGVRQRITLGVIGVVYLLTMKVTLSASAVFEKDCYLGILIDDPQVTPPSPSPPVVAIHIHGTPPSGLVGTPYSFTFTADGGTGIGYVFDKDSGSWPPGLLLNTTTTWTDDTVAGTPTTKGTYGSIVMRVTDSGANFATETVSIQIFGIVYLIVGENGNILTSTDTVTWTIQTSGTVRTLLACGYGNGLFVVCGGDSGGNVVLTSPDGITWTRRTTGVPSAVDLSGVAYGASLYAITTRPGGASDGAIITSADGITWSTATIPSGAGPLSAIVFANNQFVATSKTGKSLTSPDGITWTKHTMGTDLLALTWSDANAKYLAVGDMAETEASSDGASWTFQSAQGGSVYSFLAVQYGVGFYVAGSNGSVPNSGLWKTTTGLSWTQCQSAGVINGIGYVNGLFIAGESGRVWVSTDTVVWNSHTLPAAFTIYGVMGVLLP